MKISDFFGRRISNTIREIKGKSPIHIPKGSYCYDEEGVCYYWSIDERHKDLYQENGYCRWLAKGDYDLNREKNIDWIEVKQKDGSYKRTEGPFSAVELGFPCESLLWEKIKVCSCTDDDKGEKKNG